MVDKKKLKKRTSNRTELQTLFLKWMKRSIILLLFRLIERIFSLQIKKLKSKERAQGKILRMKNKMEMKPNQARKGLRTRNSHLKNCQMRRRLILIM